MKAVRFDFVSFEMLGDFGQKLTNFVVSPYIAGCSMLGYFGQN